MSASASNAIDSLFLSLTQQCNLECSYCSADAGPQQRARLAEADARQAVVRWLRGTTAARVQLVLSGGEPTLWGYDSLEALCTLARQEAQRRDLQLNIGVQTNGTRVDVRFVSWCLRHRIEPSISLDGPPAVSDRQRGQGQRTLEGIRRLQASGITPALILCVTREVADDIEGILDWLRNEGLTKVRFNFLSGAPPGRGVDALSADEIFAVKLAITLHMQRHGDRGVRDWNTEKLLAYAEHFWATGEIRKSHCDELRCGAGEQIAAVNPGGGVALCIERSMTGGLPVADPQHLAEAADAFWSRASLWSECEACPARVICDQGCAAYHAFDKRLFETQCQANQRYWRLLCGLRAVDAGGDQPLAPASP